jgi:hypothetical protein
MKRRKKLLGVTDTLLVDESYNIHRKKGNGVVRRQVWINKEQKVTRYNLAYINHFLFHGDNGRVLGYDNAHGYHHKHYLGTIEPIEFETFEELEKKFEQEFEVLHAKTKK